MTKAQKNSLVEIAGKNTLALLIERKIQGQIEIDLMTVLVHMLVLDSEYIT